MGLLDFLNSPDMRQGIAMLAAAGPSREPLSFGQRMQGFLQGQDAQEQALRQRALAEQLQQAQLAHVNSQTAETRAQAQQRQAEAEKLQRQAAEVQRQRQLIQQAFAPTMSIQANAASGVTGPRPEALQAAGQRAPVDFQQLIAQGVPPELVKQLAESANYGAPEVARTIDARDEQGRPVTLQFDKQGRQIGQGVQQWKAPEWKDVGGKLLGIDMVTGKPLYSFDKSQTPDSVASNATTRRGQDLVDSRAREKNSIDQAAVGKVEWKQDVNGNWVGLPREVSGQGPVTPVTTTTPGKRETQARNALDIIGEAEKLIGKGTGSLIGAGVDLAGKAVGFGTPGAVAGGQLKALEGALMMAQPRMEGPQSDKDVALYRQMAAQIGDPTVPASIKKGALETVKSLHQKYAGGPVAGAGPRPGVVDGGYRFKGGNPADPNSWERI